MIGDGINRTEGPRKVAGRVPYSAERRDAGETLHGLAKRHDISRNLIRIWVQKYEAGVYDDPVLRVPIVSVRLGNEVAEFPQPTFEYLASDSESFAEYVRVRANRQDDFYKVPAGGVDVCNVQVPIRRVPGE